MRITDQDFPDTPEGWCDYWHLMDQVHDTDPRSPLHHDNRCRLHRKDG